MNPSKRGRVKSILEILAALAFIVAITWAMADLFGG